MNHDLLLITEAEKTAKKNIKSIKTDLQNLTNVLVDVGPYIENDCLQEVVRNVLLACDDVTFTSFEKKIEHISRQVSLAGSEEGETFVQFLTTLFYMRNCYIVGIELNKVFLKQLKEFGGIAGLEQTPSIIPTVVNIIKYHNSICQKLDSVTDTYNKILKKSTEKYVEWASSDSDERDAQIAKKRRNTIRPQNREVEF